MAKKRLERLNISNVTILLQDGFFGYAPQAPFDRIILTAAVEEIPSLIISQLKVGGIMIVPVGLPNQKQSLLKVVKNEKGLDITELMSVRFVQMKEGLVKA
jgi:protein-L-isoaspartate(D-aspartate) O-methyltransferase